MLNVDYCESALSYIYLDIFYFIFIFGTVLTKKKQQKYIGEKFYRRPSLTLPFRRWRVHLYFDEKLLCKSRCTRCGLSGISSNEREAGARFEGEVTKKLKARRRACISSSPTWCVVSYLFLWRCRPNKFHVRVIPCRFWHYFRATVNFSPFLHIY